MSFVPCAIHGVPHPGKLATVLSWWFESEDERVCYRQYLCASGLTELMDFRKDGVSLESSDVCICTVCGQDASESLAPIWLNIYPPKREVVERALTTCTSCALPLRERFKVGAKLMPTRSSVGASAPTTTPESDWDSVTL